MLAFVYIPNSVEEFRALARIQLVLEPVVLGRGDRGFLLDWTLMHHHDSDGV